MNLLIKTTNESFVVYLSCLIVFFVLATVLLLIHFFIFKKRNNEFMYDSDRTHFINYFKNNFLWIIALLFYCFAVASLILLIE